MLSHKPWSMESLLRFLMTLFLGVALVMFGSMLGDRALSDVPEESRRFLISFVGTGCVQVMTFLLVSRFLRANQMTWSTAFGFWNARRGWVILLGAVTGLAVFGINLGLAWVSRWILQLLTVKAVSQPAIETLRSTEDQSQIIMIALTALVLAPVVEELLFRGVLYPAIKQAGFPGLALWSTALLFAATHANLMTFVPLTFFAVAQTLLYEHTDNLLAPIVAHSLFNATNFGWVILDRYGFPA